MIWQNETSLVCFVVVRPHGQEKEKHTGDEALNSRDCKLLVVEEETQLTRLIQLRVLESELGLDVLVEEAEGEDGEGGVAKIVH